MVQRSKSTHPFVIHSASSDLADGFPHISLPPYLPSDHVAHDYWSHFIDCVNAKVKAPVSPTSRIDGRRSIAALDMEDYVTQWSAEFFEPRGLQVQFRRLGDVVPDANTSSSRRSSCPSLSFSHSRSLSFSLSQSNATLPVLSEPPDGWMSKKAAAARASGKKVDEKLERERQKHDAHVQATARKAQKAAKKLEKSARKQIAQARRREGTNTGSSSQDPDRNGRAIVLSADEQCWELVVQPL